MPTTTTAQRQIRDGAVNNAKVQAGAGIELSKIQNGTIIILNNGTVAMAADLNLATYKLINVGDPTAAQDAATKAYVDSAIAGQKGKEEVVVATTANITLSGTQTIDGIGVLAGDRVLVKNQTASEENGIYEVAAGSWSRTTDADTWDELVSALVFVEKGTANADKAYLCTIDKGGTLGTTAVTWVTFGSSAGLVAADFVQKETPTGAVNGTNDTYNLAFTPVTGSEEVYLNGHQQDPGGSEDYTISGATITMNTPPVTGDKIRVSYIKS